MLSLKKYRRENVHIPFAVPLKKSALGRLKISPPRTFPNLGLGWWQNIRHTPLTYQYMKNVITASTKLTVGGYFLYTFCSPTTCTRHGLKKSHFINNIISQNFSLWIFYLERVHPQEEETECRGFHVQQRSDQFVLYLRLRNASLWL